MDIPEIKARYSAASEAPWTVGNEPQLNMVAECGDTNDGLSLYVYAYHLASVEADADFIAHARTDLPDVVQALAEAQAAGRKAQDEWEEWIESELGGTSLFKSAMRSAKKNRAILGEKVV